MKKTIVVYGSIAGGLLALGMFLTLGLKDKIDLDQGMYYGFAMMILSLSLIYVAIRQYRDQHLSGSIGFGKAFLLGLGITLLASSFYVLAWMIEFHFFLPDFMEVYAQHELAKYQTAGMDAATLAQKTNEMNAYKDLYNNNPWFRAGITYTEILPVGILISLICALVLKRKRAAQ